VNINSIRLRARWEVNFFRGKGVGYEPKKKPKKKGEPQTKSMTLVCDRKGSEWKQGLCGQCVRGGRGRGGVK